MTNERPPTSSANYHPSEEDSSYEDSSHAYSADCSSSNDDGHPLYRNNSSSHDDYSSLDNSSCRDDNSSHGHDIPLNIKPHYKPRNVEGATIEKSRKWSNCKEKYSSSSFS